MSMYDDLKRIFHLANKDFMDLDMDLFKMRVAERTLCGALMLRLYEQLKQTKYADYYVDVEYNRNKGNKLEKHIKTINGPISDSIRINCDLIVHSRGKNLKQDNLIAIEMKKSIRSKNDKENDRIRLKCLTKDSFDDSWSFDGQSLPKHVCRYVIGIYYEININRKQILLEYYYKGHLESSEIVTF